MHGEQNGRQKRAADAVAERDEIADDAATNTNAPMIAT